jgi:hypothetical protein
MSFDGSTGTLWIGGRRRRDGRGDRPRVAGENYGWPHCEGTLPAGCEGSGDIDPIFTYLHSGPSSLGTCLIGGAFAGSAFGPLAGDYVFGDCISSIVYRVTPNAARNGLAGLPTAISTNAGTPSDFVTGPDGAIYYVANAGGDVRRLATVASMTTSSTITTSTTILAPPSTTTTAPPCTTARCMLGAALTSSACADQPIPRSVTAKLGRAERLIDQAATSASRKARKLHRTARRLVRQAGAKATHAAKGKKAKLSAACAAALSKAAVRVATGL